MFRFGVTCASLLALVASQPTELQHDKSIPESHLRRGLSHHHHHSGGTVALDPKSVEVKTGNEDSRLSKRKFVAYHSSEWELLWLGNVDRWQSERSVCQVLLEEQAAYVHDFLNMTCTSRLPAPYDNWCVIDDSYHPLWYNTNNRGAFEMEWERPAHIPADVQVPPPQPVQPIFELHGHIASRMVFLDETTGEEFVEYIEPLVSTLRFPLCKCIPYIPDHEKYKFRTTTFRGWIIPPPTGTADRVGRKYYFDAGASDWSSGAGGPSLKYFADMWMRHGMEFDDIYSYEIQTTPDAFYETVPEEWKERTHYQQCAVSSFPEDHSLEHPFLPIVFQERAQPDDYVLFKLDIDSPGIETSNIEYILNHPHSVVDEVVWEHHIRGNYLLMEWRGPNGEEDGLPDLSLRESYEYFLMMRQKGIRAHSWV